MTNSPQDPDQTAPMERLNWSEPGTTGAPGGAFAQNENAEAVAARRAPGTLAPEKKVKKPFTSRKLTLILGAIVFFLAGTCSGIGLNIAFGHAGGGASQMSHSGAQMPGSSNSGTTSRSGTGNGYGNGSGSGVVNRSGSGHSSGS